MQNLDWMTDAACKGLHWMTDRGRADEAREVCLTCPVSTPCGTWVLDPATDPVAGVVAGMTVEERGQRTCSGCGNVVRRRDTRNGKCWVCYKAEKATEAA